jgi:hypothetical protein
MRLKRRGMDIQHDKRQRKFFTFMADIEYSLEYNEIEPTLWEFHCNFISNIGPNIKEREIRDKLIEYAIYYMTRNSIQMFESGSCNQVREFLDKKKNFEYLIKYMNK